MSELSLKYEIQRKLVHLSSCIIPLSLLYLDKAIVLLILITFSILFPLLDILRMRIQVVSKIYSFFFNSITRKSEKRKLTGASYVFRGEGSITNPSSTS